MKRLSLGTVATAAAAKLAIFAVIGLPLPEFASAHEAGVRCVPISERPGTDPGCWIVADQPVGNLTKPQTFWYLDVYPTRALAEAVKGPHGAVVESFGKQWLLSIEDAGWRAPAGGERIAEIGPLPVKAGETYTAQYMEAVFNPGMTAPTHMHSGPEAWYTLTGETCLETPDGIQIGRPGGQYVIVPGGAPMHLTATGKELRQALVLILHDSTKPASMLVSDWTPKGLCKD
jgi:quercetin dioxygenase-like cupin family protein